MEKENCRKPKVSVIMPAYRAGAYIEQAIRSVNGQAGDISTELIIIDDGSRDGTEEIVAACRRQCRRIAIRYIENAENKGISESRNIGIRAAEGEYIAFLDADDWWSPDKLKRQVELLEREPVIGCCTARELMHADGGSTGRVVPVPEEITYRMLLKTNSIPLSSAVVRREALMEFPFCRDDLHEDYILWLKLLKKYGRFLGINRPMLKTRLSENGKSRNKLKSARMQYGVYRFLGFGRLKALLYFLQYTWYGFQKYYG